MKSQITARKIGLFLVMLVGILFACYAGGFVADENYVPIAAVLGALIFSVVLFSLGGSTYLLIPICWGLGGSIHMLPLPFSVRELAIIVAGVIFLSSLIFKIKQRGKTTFETIDLWLWINLAYLITVFFRNPVGINVLGGDRVGGKPYVDILLGVLAYLMLSRFRISGKFSKKLVYWWIGIGAFSMFAGAIAMFLPGIGTKLSLFYSEFGGGSEDEVIDSTSRLEFLSNFGVSLSLYAVCMVNPMELISPARLKIALLYLTGVICILFSGFRNAIGSLFLITAMASFLRERFEGVIKIVSAVFFLGLFGVLMSFSSIELPWTFQRSLSFLPGNWDKTAKDAAESSTEWRHEMWRIALTSDRYIRNKILGDGFGFLRSDYEIMIAKNAGVGGGFEGESATQEAFMIAGEFHSGPVSSIRFVGAVGLCLFLPLLIVIAAYAYKLIRLTQGTPFQLCSLYFGIPVIVYPLFFLFIFGDFPYDFFSVLYEIGILKMLRGSLIDYQRTHKALRGVQES